MLWAAIIAAVTLLLLRFRADVDKAHVTLVYLLVVLAGTIARRPAPWALHSRAPRSSSSTGSSSRPYNTLAVNDPLDWLVLLAFLAVSAVVAQMLHRLRVEAAATEQRAVEIDQFAALGAETLNVARADEALAGVAEVIRTTLGLTVLCDPPARRSRRADPGQLVAWTFANGRVAIRQVDGTTPPDPVG